MTTPFSSTPGEASPGTTSPGAPFSTSGGPVPIGTTPVLLASAPAGSWPGPRGRMTLTSVSATVYLGGPNVSATNGAAVSAPVAVPLFGGDSVFACTASGTATVSVLMTGA